jgi:hypothetical protein
MLPSRPPLFESGISRKLSYGAVNTAPKTRVERSVKKLQMKAVSSPELLSYVGTKTKLWTRDLPHQTNGGHAPRGRTDWHFRFAVA